MQKAMNFNDVSIVSIKGSDYRIHFSYTSKDDAINIMKKVDFDKFSSLYIKMSNKMSDKISDEISEKMSNKMSYGETIYYQRNWKIIINRAKKYYKNNG